MVQDCCTEFKFDESPLEAKTVVQVNPEGSFHYGKHLCVYCLSFKKHAKSPQNIAKENDIKRKAKRILDEVDRVKLSKRTIDFLNKAQYYRLSPRQIMWLSDLYSKYFDIVPDWGQC